MGSKDSPNSQEPAKTTKDQSTFVEILKLVVPALSAIVVAYLGYLQIIQPKAIEIAATQTAAVMAQAPITQAAAIADMSIASVPAAPVATSPTQVPTDALAEVVTTQPSPTATANPAPTIATTSTPSVSPTSSSSISSSSTPTRSATTEQMALITTSEEEGAQVISVIPNTLRFQGDEAVGLRSGEFVPFANILVIDVGDVKGGVVAIELTFTDGTTQAATVKKDADLLEGETLHGAFQKNFSVLKQVVLPNDDQAVTNSEPNTQPMIAVTTLEGEMAQIVASTFVVQQGKVLRLGSGEILPFANILTVDVGEVKGGVVPIELTFTDGDTLAATLVKDADLLQGETLHGLFVKNMHALTQVKFPNEDQSATNSERIAQPMITVTTPEGGMAQIIASTLLFRQDKALNLSSGENIPFADIQSIDVGEVKGSSVAIDITFTDGTTLAATVEKDADLLEGETLHGAFQKNLYMLKRVEFPVEP